MSKSTNPPTKTLQKALGSELGTRAYRPSFEDVVAAYPDVLGDVVPRSSLRECERFAQEYVDRCTDLQNTVSGTCDEMRRCEESLVEVRGENRRLNEQLRAYQIGDSPGEPAREALRLTHRDVRNAYLQIQAVAEPIQPGRPEARAPTAHPQPPVLIARYADDEAWLVQLPEQGNDEESEDSELEGASTSSGEYTIRERSSDSSGNIRQGWDPLLMTNALIEELGAVHP